METLLVNIALSVIDKTSNTLFLPIKNGTLGMFSFLFGAGSDSLAGFFQNPIMRAFISITDTTCWLCLVFSLLFYFLKIVQEERKNWQVILMCPIKAMIFVITYKFIVQVCYLLPCYIVQGMQFIPQLGDITSGDSFSEDLFDSLSQLFIGPLTQIIFIIAVFAFSCIAIMRMGSMAIQLLTAPFYVPYVLMGDSQKMMEWVIGTVSVGFTFVVQYIMFYAGLALLIYGGSSFLNYVFAMALLFSTFLVSRQMQKFGWSSGSGHAFQSAVSSSNMLISGVRMFGR